MLLPAAATLLVYPDATYEVDAVIPRQMLLRTDRIEGAEPEPPTPRDDPGSSSPPAGFKVEL